MKHIEQCYTNYGNFLTKVITSTFLLFVLRILIEDTGPSTKVTVTLNFWKYNLYSYTGFHLYMKGNVKVLGKPANMTEKPSYK